MQALRASLGRRIPWTGHEGVRMTRFYVSPSQIARYYFHECDRYLRYRSASREQRALDRIPKYEPDRSLLTKAILEGGLAWEAELLRTHLSRRAVIADGSGDLTERRH